MSDNKVSLFEPIEEVNEEDEQRYLEMKKEYEKKNKTKYYLLYILNNDEDEGKKIWEDFIGRDLLVDFIEGIAQDMDINESLVLVENVPVNKALTVYEFMKAMEEKYDHGFDIEDYN